MPQARRISVPTANRAAGGGGTDPPPVVNFTGVQAYQTGASTLNLHSNYPTMKLVSLFISWADVERTQGVFTWPSTLDASISEAHGATGDDYRICLRVSCGRDSPIASRTSLSTPGWMATTVPYLRTLQNETNPRSSYDLEVLVPIPWDPTHLTRFTAFINAVGLRLAGPCPADSSHKRSDHIYFIPVAMPTESGTEMSIGYGQIAGKWKESLTGSPPTLATAWTASSPANGGTFVLTGDVSQIPQPASGQKLMLKVGGALADSANAAPYPSGTELVLISAFNRSTKTATLDASNGRGWSGTTATIHASGTTSVFFPDESTTSGSMASPITWNSLSGMFDHQQLNRAQWATAPSSGGGAVTEANRRVWMGDAWIAAINAQLAAMPDVKAGLAGSSVFRDNFVQANRVLDTLKVTQDYQQKLVCMTTHLGVLSTGTPGSRTYAQFDPNGSAWMLSAASYNHFCGFQTEGLSGLANGQAIIDACEDGISNYPARFIETNVGSRFSATTYSTIANGAWPGGTVTMQQYFLTHASNLQDRIPDL